MARGLSLAASTCRIVIHMLSQVAVEITWISEADKHYRVLAGPHFDPVIFAHPNRDLPIDTCSIDSRTLVPGALFVAITGERNPDEIKKMKECDFEAFLQKPIGPEDLRLIVSRLLN